MSAHTLLLALAAGCGPGGGTTEATTTTTTTASSSSTASSSGSSGSPSTTDDPTGQTGSGGSTGSSTTGTTEPGTGSSGPITASSSSGSSGGSSSGTGGPVGGPCEVDEDCQLHNDCCDCFGEPKEDPVAPCKKLCDQPMCDAIGIKKAVCRFGVCATEKVQCSGEVACDESPPDCPPGTLPGISEACWTGACVPALSCDAVPDCSACPQGTMCVSYVAFVITNVCEPLPANCDGTPSCACAGDLACTDPFTICQDTNNGALVCECPAC